MGMPQVLLPIMTRRCRCADTIDLQITEVRKLVVESLLGLCRYFLVEWLFANTCALEERKRLKVVFNRWARPNSELYVCFSCVTLLKRSDRRC